MSEALCTNLPENCSYAREARRFRAVGGHTTCPECGSRAMVLSRSRLRVPFDVPGLTAPKRAVQLQTAKPAESAVVARSAPSTPVAAAPEPSETAVGPTAPAPGDAVKAAPPPPSRPAAATATALAPARRNRPGPLVVSFGVLAVCVIVLWATTRNRLAAPPVKVEAPRSGLTVQPAQESRRARATISPKPVAPPSEEPSAPASDAPSASSAAAPPLVPTQPAPVASPPLHHIPVVRPPVWERRPTTDEIAQYYPDEARASGEGGRVTLNCRVARTGALVSCEVGAETPQGLGFGEAALRMTRLFRMSPKTVDGVAVDGAPLNVPIAFEPDQ